ncbi:MAG TPA: M42 family peptidase, partial [Blastocatellia bacterium]
MKIGIFLGLAILLALPPLSNAAQGDATVRLLETLSNVAGPPGLEEPVRRVMVEQMKPYADRVSFDGLGSVIAVQGSAGPRIMVDAHMDELGGMIRRITPNGYLSMQMLGGWLDQALVDQRWVIIGSKGPVEAVTGIRDIHIVPPDERTRVFPRDSILLDVGATNAEQVRAMGIDAGSPVVPDSPFQVLNGTPNYLGKAWDDRIGCAVLIEAMGKLAHAPHPNQVFYAATVQEEVGSRGAQSAADVIKPQIGIALEAGVTGDSPGGHPEESQVRLGAGPGIFLYDSSELPNRKLVEFITQTARDAS